MSTASTAGLASSPSARPLALVTGAGGAIGSAVAARFADDGYEVVAADLSAERLDELREGHPAITTEVADISTPAEVDRLASTYGHPIRVLCNAAGVSDGGASIDELGDELWQRVIRINLTSIYLLCNRFVPSMLASGGGVVLNVASVAGLRGGRSGAAYTASKWAVVGMTQNIAASAGPGGVRAHAICPSRIQGAVAMGQGVTRTPGGIERAARDAGRPAPGVPKDVADLASFLASDAASHLNGLAVPLDGGWLAY